MSASIYSKSGDIIFTNAGRIAPGAKLYFYDAETTTPRNTYSDSDLTAERTHPVLADGNGRVPVIYLAYGAFDVKVTTTGGQQLFYHTNLANPAPFDDDTTFDTTAFITTGHIWPELVNESHEGAVRLNGKTIGNASSPATERANADTSNLFAYLYNKLSDTQAPVSGGRTGSAANDFAANKTLTLPSWRGTGPVGFDDMGNTAASLLGSAPVVTGSTILSGSILGANTHTLLGEQLPTHAHVFSATTGTESADHTHAISITSGTESADHTHSISITSATESQSHTHTGTSGTESADHTHTYNTATTKSTTISWNGGGANNTLNVWHGADASVASGGKSATHTHGTTTGNASQTHTHSVSGTSGGKSATHTHLVSGTSAGKSATHTHTITGGSTDSFGSSAAHNNLARSGLVTWFIKL